MNKKFCFLVSLLVFICCISVASASEDISNNVTSISDNLSVEGVGVVDVSDQSVNINEESNSEMGIVKGSNPVSTWSSVKELCECSTDQTIYLGSSSITVGDQITFKNNATIIGNANGYFTGGNLNIIPFVCDNSSLSITFKNVNFKNMTSQMAIKLAGNSKLENCTFIGITTQSGRNSVIYNTYGTMNITDCTVTNCSTGYGALSNYNPSSQTNVVMNVKNSKFENNQASVEPGVINNCGILTVYNSTFIKNRAAWWAGAIHTHSKANTVINKSIFKDNVAGWNGGALFTYSVLKVYNSIFDGNNCTTNTGGGAIGSYNYGSKYNILVKNCTFIKNNNLNSDGRGGAISTLNGGFASILDSTFIKNYAVTGQAICAVNQYIENGTNDTPRLSVNNNIFINHTGSSNTVYVIGNLSSFNYNQFINSTQSPYPGIGNNYTRLISLPNKSNSLLGASNEDIIRDFGGHDIIYINVSSSNDPTEDWEDLITGENWELAYGTEKGLSWAFDMANPFCRMIIANGNYTAGNDFSQKTVNIDGYPVTIVGYGDNVRFNFPNGYVLDYGRTTNTNDGNGGIVSTFTTTFIHEKIIFDCDVKVGSKHFKFINCTFNKNVEVTRLLQSDYMFNISFENCTFANPKSNIVAPNNTQITFDENCTFPITAVDSNVTVSVGNITYGDNFTINVNLLNNISGNVSVNINNKTYIVNVINGTGSLNVSDKLDAGNYNVLANYTGDNTTAYSSNSNTTFNVSKLNTILNSATKVIMTYNTAKKLTITLKDAKGNLLTNVTINIEIGNKNTQIKTNDKGQTIFNIPKLTPKTYKVIINFEGNNNYDKATTNANIVVKKANPKLIAVKKTFKVKVKTKKLTATLKDNKGKVLKNTKLTLKIKGKKYTAKTNKKGQATFKVKLNKKGTYKGTVKFTGNKLFNTVSKTVKIVVKK